jgi:hypothetical protein
VNYDHCSSKCLQLVLSQANRNHGVWIFDGVHLYWLLLHLSSSFVPWICFEQDMAILQTEIQREIKSLVVLFTSIFLTPQNIVDTAMLKVLLLKVILSQLGLTLEG